MKRLVTLLLAVVMTFTCVACGGAGNGEIKDATDLLNKSWTQYKKSVSEDFQFPVGGGNPETIEMDKAAKFDTTLEYAEETLNVSFCISSDAIAMTDDISTLMNMMMANNFTAAAYHVADAANVETVVADIKETTANNQWMCGMPDKLIIVTVNGEYVVSAFGNGEAIDYFKAAITEVCGDAAVVAVEENITE